MDFEDIHCEGITKITPEDIKYAKAMHRAIKLLASSRKVGDSYTCLVAPYMIDDTHPLSGVNGVFNGVFYVEMCSEMLCSTAVEQESFQQQVL